MTTIGQQLLQARKKRGLSLQDVAHKTRIPVPRLQDLEADNYNSHGGLIYAKGFLRTYAAHLQVDASLILDRLQPPPLAGKRDYTYLVKNLGPWIKARQFKALTPKRATASQGGSVLSMSLIVGAIVLLGTSLMFANAMFNSGVNEPAADTAETETPVLEEKVSVTAVSLPPISSKDISQASWTGASGVSPTFEPESDVSSVKTSAPDEAVPVAIPVGPDEADEKSLPAPVKAIPVE